MSLSDKVLDPAVRPKVVADLSVVADNEVKSKGGLGGAAIKAAYAAAKKAVPAIPGGAIDELLPAFAAKLDPFWEQFDGQGSFGAFLAGRGDEVSDELLAITDARVAASGKEPIKKTYKSLRGKAHNNVKSALPALGDTLAKYAA